MFKLFKLIQRLFMEGTVTHIWCTDGKLWIRKLNYADACPTISYFGDGSTEWKNKIKPLGRYKPWKIRLMALWMSGAGLSFKIDQNYPNSWSLSLAR